MISGIYSDTLVVYVGGKTFKRAMSSLNFPSQYEGNFLKIEGSLTVEPYSLSRAGMATSLMDSRNVGNGVFKAAES